MSEKVEIVATMPVRSRPVTLQWASVNSYNGLLLRHVFVDQFQSLSEGIFLDVLTNA